MPERKNRNNLHELSCPIKTGPSGIKTIQEQGVNFFVP
jgi:hypothetical protein